MVRKQLTPVVLTALLAGCATVGPNYHLPERAVVNLPAAQAPFVSGGSLAAAQEPPDHWWKLFNNPTLDTLIERALAANTDLRVAEANLERSQALVAEARGGQQVDPSIDASISYVQQSAESYLQHVQPPQRTIYNTGVGATYDLDLFGGLRRGIEASRADGEAALAARDLVRVNVAAETARAYADLCNAGNQIDVVNRLLKLQNDSLRLTSQMIRFGRSPSFDRDRQQTTIEATRARLPQLLARQRNAGFRIATLMGQPPASSDASLLACHSPLSMPRLLPVGDGKGLLERRPDIRAAERRLAAATARIGVATAALYPTIKLGVSIGTQGRATDFLSPLTNRFGIGPLISWDLRRSVVRARIAEADADTKARLATFDGIVLTALRDVEIALNTYAADVDRLNNLRGALKTATIVSEQTQRLRRGGKVGGLTVIDAERGRIAAEEAVTGLEADINADQVALFLALGGGWR
jgi:NodT family efflux transporter outer membrane factor (OMF) lipoprotein